MNINIKICYLFTVYFLPGVEISKKKNQFFQGPDFPFLLVGLKMGHCRLKSSAPAGPKSVNFENLHAILLAIGPRVLLTLTIVYSYIYLFVKKMQAIYSALCLPDL